MDLDLTPDGYLAIRILQYYHAQCAARIDLDAISPVMRDEAARENQRQEKRALILAKSIALLESTQYG